MCSCQVSAEHAGEAQLGREGRDRDREADVVAGLPQPLAEVLDRRWSRCARPRSRAKCRETDSS